MTARLVRSIDMHLRSYVNPIFHCLGDDPKVEAPCRHGRNGCDATEARSLTTLTKVTKQEVKLVKGNDYRG
jgi:hypothetical protein